MKTAAVRRCLLALAVKASIGAALSGHLKSIHKTVDQNREEWDLRAPVNQSLRNNADMQYTGMIKVGGQSLEAIFDTGSFELLVFSSRCSNCGSEELLYRERSSPTYHLGSLLTEHSFGSGTTQSTEAYDAVEFGDMVSRDQVFWEVIGAEMPVLKEAAFQAILGIGPPRSAVTMAEEDAEAAKKAYLSRGTISQRDNMVHFAEVVKHAQNATSIAAKAGLRTFSMCLETSSGSPGWMVWHDLLPRERPADVFRIVPVVGNFYWSAELTDVKLGPTSSNLAGVQMGCQTKRCSAVFDSGTSLLSAPQKVVEYIEHMLRNRPNPTAGCDDLTGLPDLEFKINGEFYNLPPSSYVGELQAAVSSELVHLMPHLRNKRKKQGCVATLMTLDSQSQFGNIWVLGMPFFRKYYSTFHMEEANLPRPAAKTMAFAKHDGKCHPKSVSLMRGQTVVDDRPLQFDANKVNVPRWLHAASKSGSLQI